MKITRIAAFFLILISLLCLISCSQRKQTPAEPQKESDQDKSKGYNIYINAESLGKNVMYSSDVSGKKKEKVYEKNPLSAAGYGEKIAFLSRESNKLALYIINADKSGQVSVINNAAIKNNTMSWSPDGKRITFVARNPVDKSDEIYYVEAGKNKTPVKVTEDEQDDDSPKFSSDGKMIVYVKEKDKNYDICKYDVGSQTSVNMSKNAANDISPVVSPDGTKILFLSDEKEKGKYNLYMMNIDGGARTELTTGLNIVKDTIKVSPDNSMVAFITINERRNRTVHLIDMNKTTVMIADDAYITTWSNDSKMLYYATFDPKNRKIVEYDVVGKTMRDAIKIEYKPGDESTGIKFLHFTNKLK